MRSSIPILAATLALTVFLTSLLLETRQEHENRASISFGPVNSAPDSEALFGEGQAPSVGPNGPETKVDLLLTQAWRFYEAGNPQGSAELLRAVLKIELDNKAALCGLGTIAFAGQNYTLAEECLSHLLTLSEAGTLDSVSRMRLAVAQMRQKKYKPALEHLTLVNKAAPDDGAVNFALACVYASLDQSEMALTHLKLAHEQLGFGLLAHAQDPQLDSIRETETFSSIMEAAQRQFDEATTVVATPQPATPAPDPDATQ